MSGSTEHLETNDLDLGRLKMRRTSAAGNSKGGIVNTKNASESPIRIYLLAQNRLVREVLVRMFRKRTDLAVVGVNHDSAGAIAELTETPCDVLLLDSLDTLRAIGQTVRVAARLQLSQFTVKNHIRRVMTHLHAGSRHQAVDVIRTSGLSLTE